LNEGFRPRDGAELAKRAAHDQVRVQHLVDLREQRVDCLPAGEQVGRASGRVDLPHLLAEPCDPPHLGLDL
jgi:hypothetical protein